MTSILYNYHTEYTTKWKHSVLWYDVAENSRIKTCSLLAKLWIVDSVSGLMA